MLWGLSCPSACGILVPCVPCMASQILNHWTTSEVPQAMYFFFKYKFIYFNWRLLTLHYCSGFAIHWRGSATGVRVFPILNPPPTSLSIPSLWVIPVHQPRALVSGIQPGLVICFILDNIHVSMLFSQIIPLSSSPTESKRLFCVHLCLFCCLAYRVIITVFLNSIYMC